MRKVESHKLVLTYDNDKTKEVEYHNGNEGITFKCNMSTINANAMEYLGTSYTETKGCVIGSIGSTATSPKIDKYETHTTIHFPRHELEKFLEIIK